MTLSWRLSGVALLVALAACSRYYSDDPAVDAGPPGAPDAGSESAPAEDAGTDARDSAAEAATDGGADCGPTVLDDFASVSFPPPGWLPSLSVAGNPTLGLDGGQLTASVEVLTAGTDAKAEIVQDVFVAPTAFGLDYDLGLGTLTGIYIELGCTLVFYDLNGDSTTVVLSLDAGKLAIDGAADTIVGTSSAKTILAVSSNGSYHVRLDGTLTPTTVVTRALVTTGLTTSETNTITLPLAAPTTKMKLECGIRYADLPAARVGGTFAITIDNVALAACP